MSNCLPKWLYQFLFSSVTHENSVCSTSSPAIVVVSFVFVFILNLSHPNGLLPFTWCLFYIYFHPVCSFSFHPLKVCHRAKVLVLVKLISLWRIVLLVFHWKTYHQIQFNPDFIQVSICQELYTPFSKWQIARWKITWPSS